jgi:hypothetical protein
MSMSFPQWLCALSIAWLSVSAHAGTTNEWIVVDDSTLAFERDSGESLMMEATCPKPNTPRYEFTHSIPTMGLDEAESFIYAPNAIDKYGSYKIYRLIGNDGVVVFNSVDPEAEVVGLGANQVFVTRGYHGFDAETGESHIEKDILEADESLTIRYKETASPALFESEFPVRSLKTLMQTHLGNVIEDC